MKSENKNHERYNPVREIIKPTRETVLQLI